MLHFPIVRRRSGERETPGAAGAGRGGGGATYAPPSPHDPGALLSATTRATSPLPRTTCRWQVADLGEAGRNVNNWHWTEKDALPWCRDRLQGGWGWS